MKKIAVIGAGSWGTAIANLLANKGYNVLLWAREQDVTEGITKNRHNPRYLKDIEINENVYATCDIKEATENALIVVMATPSHTMRDMAKKVHEYINKNAIVVSLAKGIEEKTLKRMSEVIHDELSDVINNRIGVLSGPNHAEEVSKNIPSATVISSLSKHVAEELQSIFMTPDFRVYTNPDLVGVELGGAVKNVIALAAGMSDGLGYGDNSKASLLTRGLAEIIRLGTAMGADARTFAGLAGIGDLVVTCMSKHSRNRAAGEMFGRGMNLDEVISEMTMVAEGIKTARAVKELALRNNVSMPITENVVDIIYNGKNPREVVPKLMSRGAVEEMSGLSWANE